MESAMVKTKKIGKLHIAGFILLAVALLPAAGHIAPAQSPAGQTVADQQKSEAVIPGKDLEVYSGKSLVLNSEQKLKGVSVADPAIAHASVISSNKILINGLKAGSTTLLYWDDAFVINSHELHVQMDLEPLRSKLQALFPNENIEVSPSGNGAVLSGSVSSPAVLARVEALAKTETPSVVNMLGSPSLSEADLESLRKTLKEVYPKENLNVSLSNDLLILYGSPSKPEVAAQAESLMKSATKNVVNMTSTPHIGDVVSLKVRIAEVQRSALQELGANFVFKNGKNGGASSATKTGIGFLNQADNALATEQWGLSDIAQLGFFRSGLDVGGLIHAFVERNLAQVLAEPNLLAASGKEASFLAGGELPIPIAQTGAGTLTFTILWKEFGVRLKFTPTVIDDKIIRMKVAPEVSSLDYTNGVSLPGSSKPIPAIATRKAETEIELLDGQSFAIAGLIDNRLTNSVTKIPGLGDIPILGYLFRSKAFQRTNSELLVLVTPQLIKPLNPDQLPTSPQFPQPFMDKEKFDGKNVKTPAQKEPKQP
jgi:pilus assembly protein CpaC